MQHPWRNMGFDSWASLEGTIPSLTVGIWDGVFLASLTFHIPIDVKWDFPCEGKVFLRFLSQLVFHVSLCYNQGL